jgi:Tol biopolymer transport system component
MDTDGRNQRLVYDVGEIDPERAGDFIGAADPTPSPDGRQLVFSMENPRHKNYPNISGLNTAHDLYVVNIDGSGLRRLTAEGPISIIPDWQGNEIVYTEINEAEDYRGISVVRQDDTGKRRLGPGNAAKWLRPRN